MLWRMGPMSSAILPSGASIAVYWNPLVFISKTCGLSEDGHAELEQAIKEHLRGDQRLLDIAIHNWQMFVIWGTRGSDCRSLPAISLGGDERNRVAILRRLDQVLASCLQQ